MQLKDLLINSNVAYSDRIAVTDNESHYTYQQLFNRVSKLAGYLKEIGFKKGERVGVLLENSFEYVIAFLAVTMADLVVVPIDNSAGKDVLTFILNDCNIKTLITEKRFRRILKQIADEDTPISRIISTEPFTLDRSNYIWNNFEQIFSGDSMVEDNSLLNKVEKEYSKDLAAIFYTSGSTGQSKGVMLSHENLLSNTDVTIEYLKLTEHDSVIVILPFYYIYGNSLLLTHISAGGRLVIDNGFMYPEVVLDRMEKEKVTGFSGVPSNFMILLNKSTFAAREFKHLRYLTQAGGAMPRPVIKQLIEAVPDKQIFIMYGQTEASPRVTYLPPEKLHEKLGSIGIPLSGITVNIINEKGEPAADNEVGELVVTGSNVMMGYWNNPDEEKDVLINGALYTGDLGKKDDDGYLYIVDRKKEIIKTGGNRVSAKEIEECLMKHKDIIEVSVVGVPDDILGEAIKANLVLKSESKLQVEDLMKYCRQNLSVHKLPKDIVIRDVLPKLKSGKIDKKLLREN